MNSSRRSISNTAFLFVLRGKLDRTALFIRFLFAKQVQYPRFKADNLEKNKALFDRVALLGKKHNCTPGQIALAWLLHRGDDVVPIPGLLRTLIVS